MKYERLVSTIALPLLVSVSVAACGDDGATGGQGGQSSTSASTKSTSAASMTNGSTTAATSGTTSSGSTSASASASSTASTTASASSSATGMAAAPECLMDEDCVINDDCCECAGRPVGEVPPACAVDCAFTVCSLAGEPAAAPLCRAGRCVSPVACDPALALCDVPPPPCPVGLVPAVAPDNNCWVNPPLCVPPIECASIGTCDNCVGAGLGCVERVSFLGSTHCVTLPTGCAGDDCDCMESSVCVDPFTACGESDGHVTCTCPDC